MTVFQLTDDGSAQKKDNIQKPQEKKKDDESRFDISLFSRCSAAMSVSLMCSFSPLMWQYNISAEVFALHNLLVSSIVNVLTRFFFQPNSTRTIVAGAFLCGLALTNQHTSILLIIPVVACVVYTSSMLKKSKLLVMSSISFIAGFSIYITLPLLAFHYPHAGNYSNYSKEQFLLSTTSHQKAATPILYVYAGSWGNVTTLSGFIHHLLRRDYGTLRLYSGENTGSEGMPERTLSWAKDLLFYQLPHPVLVGYLLVGFVGVCLNRMDGSSQTRQNSVPTKTRRTKKEVARGKEPFPFKIKRWGAAERIISFALVFYLAVFHSLSNLPLSNPLLYGIHQVTLFSRNESHLPFRRLY